METDVFRRLQQQLDGYGLGFPATESGADQELLRAMFTEDEAGLFTLLTAELETPDAVAPRAGQPVETVAARLEAMALKGLLFRRRRDGAAEYGAVPFIHGLLEFQVGLMDKATTQLAGRYINESFKHVLSGRAESFQRTIPVGAALDAAHTVAPYDDACEILRANEALIVVTDCACRRQKALFEKDCGKPMDVCFMFGPMGEYYIENGLGRRVGLEEALSIQERAQRAGLVTQPATAEKPFTMCNCCGDCCGFLRAVNKHPKPAELVFTNHAAVFDPVGCSGCGTCVERCEMGAVRMNDDGRAEHDPDRCIGCGLCVTTCPEGAIALVAKPETEHRRPPVDTVGQMVDLARKRGLDEKDPSRVVSFGF